MWLLTYTATHQTLITDSSLFSKILKHQWRFRNRCRAALDGRGQDRERSRVKSGCNLEKTRCRLYVVYGTRTLYFTLCGERVQWRDCERLKWVFLAILMQSTALLQPVWDSRDSLKWRWQGPSVNLPADHRKPCTCSRLYHGAPTLYMHIAYSSTHAEYMHHYGHNLSCVLGYWLCAQ